jgi:hypothetical protein
VGALGWRELQLVAARLVAELPVSDAQTVISNVEPTITTDNCRGV